MSKIEGIQPIRNIKIRNKQNRKCKLAKRIQFGIFDLHADKLCEKLMLCVRYHHNKQSVRAFPSRQLTQAQKDLLIYFMKTKEIPTFIFDQLTKTQQDYMIRFLKRAGVIEKDYIPAINIKNEMEDLEITLGSLESGNNAPEVKNKLLFLLDLLHSKGKITREKIEKILKEVEQVEQSATSSK